MDDYKNAEVINPVVEHGRDHDAIMKLNDCIEDILVDIVGVYVL